MLLTITTTHRPATDLGELLYADPYDVRTRRFPFGEALVFFPQYDDARCTAAVLLQPSVAGPESSPSCLAVVLATMFEQSLQAQTSGHPVAAEWLPFEVQVPTPPCVDGEIRTRVLFEPLGYTVGSGADGSLWLSATLPLASLLTHLCVLLPVLDDRPLPDAVETVDRLLAKSDPWLASHPECTRIARRFLGSRSGSGDGPTHGGLSGGRLCLRRTSA